MLVFKRKKVIDRLQNYSNPEKIIEKEKLSKIPWKKGLKLMLFTLSKSKSGSKYKEALETKLIQAHIPLKPEEYLSLRFAAVFIVFLLSFIFSTNWILAAFTAGLSYYLIGMIITIKKKNILHKIDQQLPDTIVLISNSLKAGYSFMQAIDAAAKELPPPISVEFAQILKEMNLGVGTEKALESLSKRVESEDLGLMITAVMIQRQIGGNLSEILDNISETIRSRIKIKGEISILTAQGRISGLIISLLPIVLGVFMYFINTEYMQLLFENPMGWGMIGTGVIMQLIGIYSIRRIIKIEV